MTALYVAQGFAVLGLLVEYGRFRRNLSFSPRRMLYILFLTAILLGGLLHQYLSPIMKIAQEDHWAATLLSWA